MNMNLVLALSSEILEHFVENPLVGSVRDVSSSDWGVEFVCVCVCV